MKKYLALLFLCFSFAQAVAQDAVTIEPDMMARPGNRGNQIITGVLTVKAATGNGLSITGGATGGTTTISGIDGGANGSVTLAQKGGGNLLLGAASNNDFVEIFGNGNVTASASNAGEVDINQQGTNLVAVKGFQTAFTPKANSTATNVRFLYTPAADTALTASTSAPIVTFATAVRQHATGALALQSDSIFNGTTDGFVGASTLTEGATVEITPKTCGTNGTCTLETGLYIPATAVTATSATGLDIFATTGASNNYAALFETGSVGIGTNAPSTALQVIGTATATTFAGSGSGLTAVPASVLTGTTLASNVVTSSLTSVGTLTSGVWSATRLLAAEIPTDVAYFDVAQVWTAGQAITKSTPAISTATFTPNFASSDNFDIGLVHASCPCTLANPSNIVAGQSGIIAIVQSATGSDTITTYGTDYVFTNATAPTLSSTANTIDYFSYYVEDSTHIRMAFLPATATVSETATPTAGTSVTSCTCATGSCTNLRGSLTIVGGTATTGTICSLAWTATPAAYVCTATENGGTTSFGIGNSVASTTGVNLTAAVSVISATLTVNYSCQP